MNSSRAAHPSDETLQSYGLGKLDDQSSESVSNHLESCPACQRRVAELSSDSFLDKLQSPQGRPNQPVGGPSQLGATTTEQGPAVALRPAAETLPPGLADHPDYQVIRELGQGGMGTVYLAQNRLMGRYEVLKVVSSHLIKRQGVLDRFLAEIRNAARLHHTNIVTAYAASRLGEGIILAMEYVDGLDLSKLVKSKGPLPVANACNYVHQTCLGLQHAHEHGMVHRDIKPSNLMLTRQGQRAVVKVLDFGLAKVQSERALDGGLTHEGQMLGTPDYIAPEQIRDARQADIRADIYSLGCTLYYLLTGAAPFQATSLYDLLQAHHSMDATPLNLARPEVPVELAALVAKMMAKEPKRRFQTPAEVAQALTPFFKSAPPQSQSPALGASRSRAAPQFPTTPTAAVGPVPMPPSTLASAQPPVRKPSQTVADGVSWESLIEITDDEPLIEAPRLKPTEPKSTPAGGSVRLPPWKSWPLAAAASVLGLVVLGSTIYILKSAPTPETKAPGRSPSSNRGSAASSKPSPPTSSSLHQPDRWTSRSTGMALLRIAGGDFMMGSPDGDPDASGDEKPQHSVYISPFYLGETEVTQAQYQAVRGTNPSCFSPAGDGAKQVAGQSTDQLPVENVSWLDAVRFCNALSEKDGLKPFYSVDGDKVRVDDWNGLGYRLPTEAEWEYACRANSPAVTRFSFGGDAASLSGFGWNTGNSRGKTHPVGEKTRNGFGLFDMHGNVWEWCWDPYAASYYKQSAAHDPRGPDGSSYRVNRGGGWSSARALPVRHTAVGTRRITE